jgi:hypothetical protein
MGDGTGGIVTRGVSPGAVTLAGAVVSPPDVSSSSPPQAARRRLTSARAARMTAGRRGLFMVLEAIIGQRAVSVTRSGGGKMLRISSK